MSDQSGYNGWKNYETWLMALWISNEEGSYDHSRELVRQARADAKDADNIRTVEGLAADALKDWQEDELELLEMPASVWSDLLRAALGEVDWYEIAGNYLSELPEDEDETVS